MNWGKLARRGTLPAIVPALVVALACKGSDSSRSKEHAADPVATGSDVSAPAPEMVPTVASAETAPTHDAPHRAASRELTELAVKRLLDDWLVAQNEHSFESYEKAYASRFTGIKRTGSKTSKMDRRHWLLDRRQMFPRIVSVRAKDPQIALQSKTASLRFEQYWASKNYEDRGTKQMTIVLEDGLPRIAREELLESRAIGAQSTRQTPVHLVYRFGGQDYLVVGDGAKLVKPELREAAGTFVAFGDVDLSDARAMADWQGRSLRVFSVSGKHCTAEGGRVVGIALALPHFSEQGRWDTQKVPPAERAQIIAEMGRPQYAVEIDAVKGNCGDLVLGQAASQPVTKVAEETSDEAAKRVALTVFENLPKYQAQQKDLDQFIAESEKEAGHSQPKTPWTEYSPVIRSQRSFRLGDEHYVWLSYDAGPGCGGWDGGLAMLFRVHPGKELQVTPIPPPKGAFYPTGDVTSLTDVNADGRVELLLHPTFSSGTLLLDESLQPVEQVNYVNFDCPC